MDVKKTLGISHALGAVRGELKYSDMPAQLIQILLEVAAVGEISQQALEKKVGISRAAVSRFLSILSVGMPLKPGLRLVESFEDPEFRRRKIVRVTARGKAVVTRMTDAMGK